MVRTHLNHFVHETFSVSSMTPIHNFPRVRTVMRFLVSCLFSLLPVLTLSQDTLVSSQCGRICDEFVYETEDLGICFSSDSAAIWNTTSGECMVTLDASLEPVSYTSLIFTAGVTPAVRRQIGDECWDNVPKVVATWIIRNHENFDPQAMCRTYPTNSPSLGWEMRYEMAVYGFNDCASLVDLHQNALGRCVRYMADARAFATFAYMLGLIIALVLFIMALAYCCECY